ncbi:tetrahydromethanopterin S-methyltransferase, subunit A [Candidatus Nitrososphaera evergladensis SR1]|jgi:tetrahydromethanopterin S-methyltransferase subunit A|uniref:Tetrahydromethanopterin S-methyltransferase, subunit A n=1 Tax=Candidatus Nitrososphaera evergladensis SR1 TaxID=1459636 RepID=A0A075MQH4_9ARCH|nr:tetrahydromethanopterin S-methyltransferase subunit A [Candidatus Nitrososphaera evergladensis]AIF83781.1 tetrahydromethanopterin S-methyltransferase, subunit A [Candidatus Nitrososphaera evergladensis SR1]
MTFKKKFDDAAGKVCEALIPVKHESFEGEGKEVAVCTLGSIDLLEKISESETIMGKVAIAGRLLSENKGIDAIIDYVSAHPDLKRIIVCGREVKGHMAGQALLALYKNGIDGQGRIIGAAGPYPVLLSSQEKVEVFRRQVTITDMIGVIALEKITLLVA